MFSYVDIDARRAARVEAEASENIGSNYQRKPSLFPEAEKSPLWQKWNTSKGDVSAVSAMYEVGLKARIEAERLRRSSAKAERVHASPVPLENTPLPLRLNSEFAAEESEAAKIESGKGKSLSPTRALWKALGGSTLQTSPIRSRSTSQDKRDRSVSSVSTANSTASTTRGGIWKDVDSVRGGSAPGSVESVSSGQSRRPGYPRPVPGSVESVSSGQSRLPGYSRPLKNTRSPGSLILTTGSAGAKRTASTSVVTTSGGNVVRVLVLPQQQLPSTSRSPSARMMVEASPTVSVSGGLGPITPTLASTDMSHISSISSISSMASGSSRLSRSATSISAPNSGTGDNNDSSHRYSDSSCFDASHLVTYSGVSPTISVSASVPASASASAPAFAAPSTSPLPLVSELELVYEQDEEERQQEERQQKYGRDRAITSASHLAVDAAAWVEVDSPMPAAESPSSESASASASASASVSASVSVSVSVSVSGSAVSEAFLLGADGERHADNNGVERLQLEPELEQEQEQEQQTPVSTPVRPSPSRAAAQSTFGFARALLRSLLLAALAAFIAFVPVPPHHKPLLALMPPPPAIIVGKAVLLVDNVRLVSGRFVREAQARSLLPSDATINVALLQLQQHRQSVVAGSSRGLVMVVNTLSSAATQSVCVWNHHTQLSALPALPAMPVMPSMFLLPTVHLYWSRTRTGVTAFSESVLSTVSCAGCALSEMWTQSQAMAKLHSYPSLPQLALLSTLAAPVATPVAITTSENANAIANVAPATTATPLPAAEAAMAKASLFTFSSTPAASVKTTTSTSTAPADPDAHGLVPVADSTSIPLLFGMTYSAFGFVVLAVGAALVVASAIVLANLPEETLERIIEMSPVPMRRFLSPRLTRSMAKSAVKARLQRGPTPADASAGSGADSRPRRNLPRKRLY